MYGLTGLVKFLFAFLKDLHAQIGEFSSISLNIFKSHKTLNDFYIFNEGYWLHGEVPTVLDQMRSCY